MKTKSSLSNSIALLEDIPLDHIVQYLKIAGIETIRPEKIIALLSEARRICTEVTQSKCALNIRTGAHLLKLKINDFLGNE